jgi:hypothetical protein
MMMKVIFLDIDGVLNTRTTPNPRKLPYVVDPALVKRFRQLLKGTGAKGVLSSSWRYDPAGVFSAKYHGIPFIDCTPDLKGKPRRAEILSWLKKHRRVTRYVVLDDDDDELDELPLFQPSPRTGLTRELSRGISAYLRGKSDQDMRRNAVVRLARNLVNSVTGHKG